MDSILRYSAFAVLGLFVLSIFQLPVGLVLEANRLGVLGLDEVSSNFLVSFGVFLEILLFICGVLMYLGFARIAEKTKNNGLLFMCAVMMVQVFVYSLISSLDVLSAEENIVSEQALVYLLFIEGALTFVFGAGLLGLRRDYGGLGVLASVVTIFLGFFESVGGLSIVFYILAAVTYLPALLVYAALLHIASKRY